MRRSENMTFLGRGNREVWCETWKNKTKQFSFSKMGFSTENLPACLRGWMCSRDSQPRVQGSHSVNAAGNWSILAPWTCTARFWYVYAAVKQVKPTQPNQTQPTPIQIKPTKTKTNNSKHTKEPKYHNFYQLIRAGSCTFWGPQRELPRMVKGRSFPTNSLSHCWALVVAYGDRATETYIFTFWSLK